MVAEVGRAQETRISRLGEYRGYSSARYDGWSSASRYVTVRDRTRLAMDLFRPTRNGEHAVERVPVVWTHHRYLRSMTLGVSSLTVLDTIPWLKELLQHGYAVAAIDIRGTGGSFGVYEGLFTPNEARDAFDITEWLAAQPWCSGKVGMYGRSYLGVTQYLAAAEKPPHLVAIFPEMAPFDLYDFIYPGGIYRHDLLEQWSAIVHQLDRPGASTRRPSSVAGAWSLTRVRPVDGPEGAELLKAALEQHLRNRDLADIFEPLAFRDDRDPVSKARPYRDWSPAERIADINASGVAVYTMGGWLDLFTRDALLWTANLTGPKKLVIGPWAHTEQQGLDQADERLRWFDHFLKGVDNGILDEPSIHYWLMGAPEGQAWQSTDQWPLATESRQSFYFASGPSGTIDSVNDGRLRPDAPTEEEALDRYTVDYSTTSGKPSRWSNGYGDGAQGFAYRDLRPSSRRSVTYTSDPLPADAEITGHPIVTLWLDSAAHDLDVFVRLEEVDAEGVPHYVTEGALRASHRATSEPPVAMLGLPYRSHRQKDIRALPEEPVELVFDLIPLSNLFDRGHRIRITISGADAENTRTPAQDPPPELRLHRSTGRASHVELPFIRAEKR